MKYRVLIRRLLYLLLTIFVLINIIAFNHAWHFTHFSGASIKRIKYEDVGLADKIKYGFLGVPNPKPLTKKQPLVEYQTIKIESNVPLEAWVINTDSAKGTVLMFHGYKGEKSELLQRASIIRALGYNTMLVDHMGAGGSGGDIVTIGFLEAENVKDCYDYLKEKGNENVIIYGISMGAAAAMKAIKDYDIKPDKIILEAPFGSLYKATTNRFDLVNAPYFPMAHLTVLWGGWQHGFWAFGHRPEEYANYINCPSLVMYGAKDKRVKRDEIDNIMNKINGEKKLAVYPKSGHVNFLKEHKEDWAKDLQHFLKNKKDAH